MASASRSVTLGGAADLGTGDDAWCPQVRQGRRQHGEQGCSVVQRSSFLACGVTFREAPYVFSFPNHTVVE